MRTGECVSFPRFAIQSATVSGKQFPPLNKQSARQFQALSPPGFPAAGWHFLSALILQSGPKLSRHVASFKKVAVPWWSHPALALCQQCYGNEWMSPKFALMLLRGEKSGPRWCQARRKEHREQSWMLPFTSIGNEVQQ